jgi:diguanylate cyclase (GGDEF)-like protein
MMGAMMGDSHAGDALGRVLTAARDIAYDWDLPGDAIRWTGALVPALGPATARSVATGKGLSAQVHPDDRSERLLALARHLDRHEPYDCVYRLADGAGGYRWISDRGTAERDPGGQAIRMAGVLRPIDGLKSEELRLRRMAYRDDLTGLPNRRRLLHRLNRMLRTLIAAGRTGGLVVIGVDQLGMVNEVFGFPSGDAVLVEAGRRLRAEAGAEAEVARIAGDRFAVMLPGVGAAEAELACERLMRALRDEPVETPGGDLRITVSAGWLALPLQARSAGDALAKAEGAMLEVKRAGRNAVQAYSHSHERRRAQRIDLAVVDLVERALSRQRVDLAFQPIVDAGSREVRHYEALLRVGDDYGGMLNAGAVVPAAESMGLMRRLDLAVLDMAVTELERHPGISLAVNVSAVNAGRGSWIDRAIERLGAQRLLANRLMIEITETVALIDPNETARFVDTLHELGARVAIDDFGAGNTSFRALRRLGVDVVKIDGSFVTGIAENPDNRLFVRALVGIARGFGLETVAEFVETEEEALVLRDEGVGQLQGYLFGRPEMTRPWLAVPVSSWGG